MVYIYIIIGILTVNIQIIAVKLPIIIMIYMISQFHIHRYNAEDLSFPIIITKWRTHYIGPVLELRKPNCNIMYMKRSMGNLAVIIEYLQLKGL